MNLQRHESNTTHRLYCESKSGIQFDCHRISDDRIRELALAAGMVVARVPNAKSPMPDKSIRALIDLLSTLSSADRRHRDLRDCSPGRCMAEIAQLRRSVRLRTNLHPLIGTHDAWLGDRPRMLMAVVFGPLSVESCTLRIDVTD